MKRSPRTRTSLEAILILCVFLSVDTPSQTCSARYTCEKQQWTDCMRGKLPGDTEMLLSNGDEIWNVTTQDKTLKSSREEQLRIEGSKSLPDVLIVIEVSNHRSGRTTCHIYKQSSTLRHQGTPCSTIKPHARSNHAIRSCSLPYLTYSNSVTHRMPKCEQSKGSRQKPPLPHSRCPWLLHSPPKHGCNVVIVSFARSLKCRCQRNTRRRCWK